MNAFQWNPYKLLFLHSIRSDVEISLEVYGGRIDPFIRIPSYVLLFSVCRCIYTIVVISCSSNGIGLLFFCVTVQTVGVLCGKLIKLLLFPQRRVVLLNKRINRTRTMTVTGSWWVLQHKYCGDFSKEMIRRIKYTVNMSKSVNKLNLMNSASHCFEELQICCY